MIQKEGALLHVSGKLTMDAIGAIFNDAIQPLEGKQWMVDLAQVEVADSAAVGLLLSWLRHAQQHEASLEFLNVPENLRSLAALYGVADTLLLNHSSQ